MKKIILPFFKFLICWLVMIIYVFLALPCLIILGKKKTWEFWFPFFGKSLLKILGIKLKVSGLENIKGPAIFAMNHQSLIDILLLPAIAPKKSTPIAKESFKKIPFISFAMRAGSCIFVDRTNTKSAVQSLEEGLEKLPSDYSLLICPEGTRSLNFKLNPLKKGIVHVALKSKLPIITIGYYGMHKIGGKKGSLLFQANTLFIHANKKIETSHWKYQNLNQHLNEIRDSLVLSIETAKKEFYYQSKTTPKNN